MLVARLRSAPVGGYVFSAIGLLMVVISLAVPWYSTVSFIGSEWQTTTLGAFDLGIRTALYVVGALLLLTAVPAALLLGDLARQLAGICGLAASILPVLALNLVDDQIKAGIKTAAEHQGAMRSHPGAESVTIWGVADAGPYIAGIAVFTLTLALCRFAWPARPAASYAGATIATVVVAAGVPWAYQDAYSHHGVLIRQFWFASFGGAGLWFAVSAVFVIGALALTALLERRTWWPASLGLPAMLSALIAIVVAEGNKVQTPASFPDGYQPDRIVINTGVPVIWLLAGLVLATCALVMAIRSRRVAARAGMPPATAPGTVAPGAWPREGPAHGRHGVTPR